LADHPEMQPPVAELESGPSLADTEVGATKASSGPFTFGPGGLDRLALAAAVVLQLSILVAMILGRTVPYVGAQTVLLRVEPVDPRDMFRGDYVTLGYEISRIPGRKFEPGQTVYVTLVPETDGRHYRAGEFLADPPASGIFIWGIAQAAGRATYGIESFYVQEGTGHDYENAVRNRRLWAEIALDSRGTPALKRLVIE
jgi:uncharacterized membrane-anchored protein